MELASLMTIDIKQIIYHGKKKFTGIPCRCHDEGLSLIQLAIEPLNHIINGLGRRQYGISNIMGQHVHRLLFVSFEIVDVRYIPEGDYTLGYIVPFLNGERRDLEYLVLFAFGPWWNATAGHMGHMTCLKCLSGRTIRADCVMAIKFLVTGKAFYNVC